MSVTVDLSKVHWLPVACGAAAWLGALAWGWFRFRQPTPAERENDFAAWKATQGGPHATFEEFLASEQAPGGYMSRGSLCFVICAVALLALLGAMQKWGVFSP